MVAKRAQVAILIETSKAYGRGLLSGVAKFLRTHGHWSVFIDERGLCDPPPAWLKNWSGDGILIREQSDEITRMCLDRGLNVVNLGESLCPDVPTVTSNERGIVDLAVAHLLERGFRQFGYVGIQGQPWSDCRRDRFCHLVEQSGFGYDVFESQFLSLDENNWEFAQTRLTNWLRNQSLPTGLMACYDVMGLRVLDACRRAELAVPEKVAVIGVDNDTALCTLSDPPLTSVEHGLQEIGFRASQLLDGLIQGQQPPSEPILVKPIGVARRLSTDIVAIDDPKVAEACKYIRENACDGISVDQIAEHVSLSRRTLERHFTKALGRSPQTEMRRIQIDRVAKLLEDTDNKLSVVAKIAGFKHQEYMSKVFKDNIGMPPGEYRELKRVQKSAEDGNSLLSSSSRPPHS